MHHLDFLVLLEFPESLSELLDSYEKEDSLHIKVFPKIFTYPDECVLPGLFKNIIHDAKVGNETGQDGAGTDPRFSTIEEMIVNNSAKVALDAD